MTKKLHTLLAKNRVAWQQENIFLGLDLRREDTHPRFLSEHLFYQTTLKLNSDELLRARGVPPQLLLQRYATGTTNTRAQNHKRKRRINQMHCDKAIKIPKNTFRI